MGVSSKKMQHGAGFLCLLSAIAILLLAGCVIYDYRTGQPISDLQKLGVTNHTINMSVSNICSELPGTSPCSCMVCKNVSQYSGLLSFLNLFYDANLKSGECRFDNCNASVFLDLVNKSGDTLPRSFMIGNGPSFASTASAFSYCNNSLQLAVKWMKAPAQGMVPKNQSPARAACWLERDVLPLYIYYTNGSKIDPAWMGAFAKSLNDNGAYPALVATEVNFNLSDPAAVSNVKQQIVQIKQNCPKCLSVLSVSSGDYNATNAVLSDPALYGGRNLSNLTDIVGFGFRANDYPSCSPSLILGENIQFSHTILANYSKPTVWLYVGASEGNNTGGSCSFSNQTVHEFYQTAFSSIPGLVSSGVIGMNFYEFTDRTGPLPCADGEGCDFGVINASGQEKHPEMNTWSSLCQFVGTDTYRNPVVFSRNGRGFVCDVFDNWNIYTQVSTEVNTELGLKTDNVAPLPKKKGLTCGEACISDTKNSKPSVYDSTGSSFDSSHCALYPQIEDYSDDADISSTYFRSIIEQESGFKPSAVACVNLTNHNCNYNISDASYKTVAQVCAAAGVAPASCPAECPANADGSPTKPCGMGLAQCIDMPGTVAACGGASYNPFNPQMSICCGVNKFQQYISSATTFVNSHWSDLSACTNGMTDAEKPWAVYYLASNAYYGSQGLSSTTLSDFISKRDSGGSCKGAYQNYIDYLRNNDPLAKPGNSYGADVMSRYFSVVGACGSDCAGK